MSSGNGTSENGDRVNRPDELTATRPGVSAGAAAAAAPAAAADAAVSCATPAERRRVLIVEDDTLVGMGLSSHLERLGHAVVAQVSTAGDAIREFRLRQPDVVLLDIRLDGADGIELAKELLAIARRPMIIISAFSDPALVERASDAGVFGYLIKPISGDALAAQMEVAVRRFREVEALIEKNNQLMQSLENRKLVEKAKGIYMRRLNLDEPEAHRKLQQESQKRRMSIADLAKKIIESEELLGG